MILLAITLIMVTLLTSGCSSTRLAYRYADWGAVWWVEDRVTLTPPQKQQLNVDLESLKKWHCSKELPRYSAWLDSLQGTLASGDLGPTEINNLQIQMMTFIPPLLKQITPAAVNLFSSLSDEQVNELAGNMVEKRRKFEEKFLVGDAEEIAKARSERTAERAEQWLGSLNSTQQRIIKDWSEDRIGQTRIWLEGRRNWQKALLNALDNRHEPGFKDTITELINNSAVARGDGYTEIMNRSIEAMASLIQDLLLASEPSHLDHLAERASKLHGDFEALTCTQDF
ncbi:hypothetical protein LCGC14_0884940 [marine sediment metagenome]|uniref:DUF3549 domain-containing protein n=2 Tax=root TaxID=1 RepID=A0A831R1D4_9GAMM|nr:DUF6279 family lipoprotein [Marinobacter antarcticus]HEA52383.1 DUF3549 domain-containing protein [Marinobacter antarcticus]